MAINQQIIDHKTVNKQFTKMSLMVKLPKEVTTKRKKAHGGLYNFL